MPPSTKYEATTTDLDELRDRMARLEKRVDSMGDPNALAIVVFSGDLDKLLAAFTIATGAAACGMNATLFFTFWGTAALKKAGRAKGPKSAVERAFGWMLPGGFHRLKLSRFDMAGIGRKMMMREMDKKRVPSLETLIDIAAESGVEIKICEMSMSLMGIKEEELIDYPGREMCGVARFLEISSSCQTTLFL